MNDPLIYARVLHFAASITVAGVAFFVVLIAEPSFGNNGAVIAPRLLWRLALIAWIGLVVALLSGVAWLVLVAAAMSGSSLAEVFSGGLLWIVLSQTDFGNAWLARFIMACLLAVIFIPLLSRGPQRAWLKLAAVALAAGIVGGLAWAGHAIGGQGIEGVLHPAADALHLIAAAAWVGALVPLALLLAMTGADAATLAVTRTATLRFSTLGIAVVATILATGVINTWYLVDSTAALLESAYGRLLLVKMALFAAMVGIAAYNWSWLTPALAQSASMTATQSARRRLCRNAAIEAVAGALIICIVAVLGIMPPASHADHHGSPGAIPADATFQHIHSGQGMAEVMIEPGHVGMADATIHLLDDDFATLAASELSLTLTAPAPGSKPTTRTAVPDAAGIWHVAGIQLSEAGNWTVEVDAVLTSGARLTLAAPIVVYAK